MSASFLSIKSMVIRCAEEENQCSARSRTMDSVSRPRIIYSIARQLAAQCKTLCCLKEQYLNDLKIC
ncbi:hypothetical protein XENTR_v10016298 [Xenopus tropicalis]|nr:hypothetical protein XENTR_v10016298 [Xenopus tropicalis]